MAKHTEKYLKFKLDNCKELVKNATSKEQRSIYESYMEYWEKQAILIEIKKEKLDMIKQTKVIVNDTKEELEEELEEIAVDISKTRCPLCLAEFSNQGFPNHYEACKKNQELEAKRAELAELEKQAENPNQ